MNIRKETIMKVYGSQICSGCRNYKAVQQSRGFEADYVDITASTANLREFLRLRDQDPIFDSVRERGGIGIPFFVNEDGRRTLDMNEALSWIGQEPVREEELTDTPSSCSVNGCV